MYTPILARILLLALSASTLATATYQSTATVQATNMDITLYAEPNCNSNDPAANWVAVLQYGVQAVVRNATFLSYKLSRNTTLNEQLDFSGPTKGMGGLDGNPEQCTLFHETTSPDSNGNTLAENQCYGLLNGQAECVRLSSKP